MLPLPLRKREGVAARRAGAQSAKRALHAPTQLRRIGLGAVSLLLLIACGNSSREGDSDSQDDECIPGERIDCTTESGCEGTRVCGDDLAYEACRCEKEPDSEDDDDDESEPEATGRAGAESEVSDLGRGAGGSLFGDPGTPPSGSGADPAATGAGGSPASFASGGNGASDAPSAGNSANGAEASGVAGTCEPADMSTWTPPAYVPAQAPEPVCSAVQLQRFHDDCLMTGACSDFEPAGSDAPCGECLMPKSLTASAWGPVIELSPRPFYRWETNNAGCIELWGDRECATKIQAAQACAREACLDTCGITHPSYADCVEQARGGTCSDREAAAVCIMDAAQAAACTDSGFEAIFLELGSAFCG